MIPAKAVKKYLVQTRDDHRWLKKLKHKDLDRLLAELNPPPKPWHKLGLHQKVCLYLGIKYGCFAFWLDMGTGKTLVALELMQYWWDNNLLRRALIFVISDKAFSTWERQVKQYKISVPFVSLDASSSEEKWRLLDRFDRGLVLLHYPGTVAMVSEPSQKKKKGWQLSEDGLKRLLKEVDAVVLDESTKCGNTGSLTYKLCKRASKQAEFVYALAGMPFGRDPTPLWPQMFLVDLGETLGPTKGLFREAFFTEEDNPHGNEYSKNYKFRKVMKPKLSQILQHRSVTYTAEECIDLPSFRRILEEVKLSLEVREQYEALVEELIEAGGNKRVVKNAFLRMRQLSSGFLGLKDDETGERATIEFDQNPKLERTLELVDSLPENRKVLIFYQYTYSGRRLTEELTKMGLKPVWLWSGTKAPRKAMERFMEDPATTVAVVNNQLGAYSLDGLQVANYELFYESPVSAIDRVQAERRIRRQGQVRRCFYYDVICRGTVDTKILDFHREGEDLFKSLLTHPKAILRGGAAP
jgi:SNF2 family DNA or RNA helicase